MKLTRRQLLLGAVAAPAVGVIVPPQATRTLAPLTVKIALDITDLRNKLARTSTTFKTIHLNRWSQN